MEITEELLDTIRNRVVQYSLAKYNKKPDEIHLQGAGQIELIFGYSCRGSYDEDSEYINCSDLTANLDELVKERLEKERIQREQNEIRWAKEAEERKEREKQERKRKFEELKKEFEL